MKSLLFIPLVAVALNTEAATIKVDISEGRLTVFKGPLPVFTTPVQTAANGIGFKIGSGKTPTGSYTITKDDEHRFGKILRLSGYQGNARGILVHKHYGSLNGTSGCICPHTPAAMNRLFKLVKDGDRIIITR